MNLAQLLSAPLPPLDDLRLLWLVFDAALAEPLDAAQADQHAHRVGPITLSDGRLALCADLLSEINGGIFALPFSRLPTEFFSEVEVIDAAAIIWPETES
jgi:hypothetical protein